MFTAPLNNTRNSLQFSKQESSYFAGLFESLHPDKNGLVDRETLAAFFQTSNLSPNLLNEIWSLVDLSDRGRLSQEQFSKACRLIGHAQQGAAAIVPELLYVTPAKLPGFVGSSSPSARIGPSVDETEQSYRAIFDKLRVGSIIPPDAVRSLFVKSALPEKELAKIFDLSTSGSGGVMGYGEFLVAMTLISRTREGRPLPTEIPPELIELTHKPTPPLFTEREDRRREEMLNGIDVAKKVEVSLTAAAHVKDSEYYKRFDEMKRLEAALTVAKTLTGSWQDQILACQGRMGEIQNELEDLHVPEAPFEDVSDLEHELHELQTELEKVLRTKTDIRMQVQVMREQVLQRGKDSKLLSTAVAADSAKLSELRRERLRLMEALNSHSPAAVTSFSSPLSFADAVRKDIKGVRVAHVARRTGSGVYGNGASTANPGGWESFESENAVIGLPTLALL